MALHTKDNLQKGIVALTAVLQRNRDDTAAALEAVAPLATTEPSVHWRLRRLVEAGNPEAALKVLEAADAESLSASKKITIAVMGVVVGVAFLVFIAWNVIPQSAESAAKDAFSKSVVCPVERLESRPRTDISYAALHPAQTEEPGADIRNDPGRYALWQQRQKEQQDHENALHKREAYVEVRGCGTAKLYACVTAQQTINNRSSSIVRLCMDEPYPSGAPRW